MENFTLKKKQKRSWGYEIKFDKRALIFLSKLDSINKKRIWDKLIFCKENPFRYLKHLEQIEGYKLRVGDYRVILSIEEEVKVLFVEKIGHRKKIYSR